MYSSTFAFWKHIATALSSDIDPSTLRTDFANDSTFIYMPWNIILEVATFLLIIVVSLTKMGVRGNLYESFLLLALFSSAVHGGKSSCAFQNKHFVYS